MFSFNPALKAEGKNPFTLTSKEGDGTYQAFLNNETRYSALTRKFPERAKASLLFVYENCLYKRAKCTASFLKENSLVSVANDKRAGGKGQIRALAEAGGVV